MNDAWDERRRAQEDQFFDKANKDALERMARRAQPARLSPVTGKPMQQLTVLGVVLDRCPESGGFWLDAGELEQLVDAAKHASPASITQFLDELSKSGPLTTGAHVAGQTGARLSPVSGKPMVQTTVMGITVDKCPETGGIWLDAGELQRALSASEASVSHSLRDFFIGLLGRKQV
jgi:Zn-finger nucleic acid-binding protein